MQWRKNEHLKRVRILKQLLNPMLVKYIKEKKALPVKRILGGLSVPEKVLERHRKYIIAAVVILDGDYENLSGYLSFAKGGAKE